MRRIVALAVLGLAVVGCGGGGEGTHTTSNSLLGNYSGTHTDANGAAIGTATIYIVDGGKVLGTVTRTGGETYSLDGQIADGRWTGTASLMNVPREASGTFRLTNGNILLGTLAIKNIDGNIVRTSIAATRQ